jgi:hypothetical protein
MLAATTAVSAVLCDGKTTSGGVNPRALRNQGPGGGKNLEVVEPELSQDVISARATAAMAQVLAAARKNASI